ncbi:NACHT domain-containing protein [Mucilaginibacter sp.]
MLDWNKLKPYKTSREKSFEQLCFQLAVRKFGHLGVFTPIDDSGGGDGVEFYLTLESGDEWGWQCKFYEGNVRLADSNRKPSIIGSLTKSLEKHPRLKNWFLCLPLDPTPDETTWINGGLKSKIPPEREVGIIPWTHSLIHTFVNQPEFTGIWHAFFNMLELDATWFKRSFAKTFTLVSNKFDELLYVPNGEFEYYRLNPALCNAKFRQRISFYADHLDELSNEGKIILESFETADERFRPAFAAYRNAYAEFYREYGLLRPQLVERYKKVFPNTIDALKPDDFAHVIAKLKLINENAGREFYRDTDQATKNGDRAELKLDTRYLAEKSSHESKCTDLIRETEYYVRDMAIPLKKKISHFLGSGGSGKTNLCVALVKDHVDNQLPALFIPGIKLNGSNPLCDQILRLFDIPQEYNFTGFLDLLDSLGHIHNIRVPIVIDGLNEALAVNGSLNKIVREDIPQLEIEVTSRKNLVLITTCRRSYGKYFWSDVNLHPSDNFHSLDGFNNHEDLKALTKKYFQEYKIQADLSFNSLIQFSKPIYIRIFCEVTNPNKLHWKEISLGYHSIYRTFEKYTEIADAKIFRKLTETGKAPLAKYKKLASTITEKIAADIWINPRRRVDLETLSGLADPDGMGHFDQSATKAILDEELLFTRDFGSDSEHIYLTYDLMAGYFIARHLLSTVTDFGAFFNSEEGKRLTDHWGQSQHPVFEDVLTALCTLLPVQNGTFVHHLIKNTAPGEEAFNWLFNASVKAVLLLPAESIPENEIRNMKELMRSGNNFTVFFEHCDPVLFLSSHPFNFCFFEEYLHTIPMNLRDTTWTEYVRNKDAAYHEELLNDFSDLMKQPVLSSEQREKLKLVARFLMWNLTSTDPNLKRKLSQGIYDFGKLNEAEFFDLYNISVRINDPTVFEWMSVIGYNIVLQNRLDPNVSIRFKKAGEFIADTLFNTSSVYTTSHLLTRDYAFKTLEIIADDPKLLTTIKENFSALGEQNWEFSPDKNEKQYRDGNGLIHHRFEKEKMFPISAGGNEYRPTPLYNERLGNLRWRAYQLGYEFELFGELDKTIVRWQEYGDNSGVKRYADKYIDQAYYELLGHLNDLGKASLSSDNAIRIQEPKFDPAEEEVPQEAAHIVNDFIDTDIPLKVHCNDSSVPDIDPYIYPAQFKGNAGDWCLLHGFFHQCKEPFNRQLFTYVEAIFLRKKDYKRAVTDFPLATNLGFSSSVPYSTNVHAMEIPDGKAIPHNDFTKWHYTIKREMADVWHYKWFFYRDGKKLTADASDLMWLKLERATGVRRVSQDFVPGAPPKLVRFVSTCEQSKSLEKFLAENGVEMRVQKKKIRIEQDSDCEPIEIQHAVRFIEGASYPSKNIIDHCRLRKGNSRNELVDESGQLASLHHYLNNDYVDQENFTYLRRDLLDKFLADNKLEMLYIVSGERDWYPPGGKWDMSRKQAKEREWTKHFKIIPYNSNSETVK